MSEPQQPQVLINRVSYRRVFNLGNYQSESIEAEAYVPEGMGGARTLEILREWVLKQQARLSAGNSKAGGGEA